MYENQGLELHVYSDKVDDGGCIILFCSLMGLLSEPQNQAEFITQSPQVLHDGGTHSVEKTYDVEKHMKIHATSLIVREMKIQHLNTAQELHS